MLAEGVDHRRVGVGHEQHVRLLDLLEPPDRGSVEPEALLEDVLGELMGGDREVLHQAGQVDEPDIDDLDALVLHQAQHFRRGPLLHGSSLVCFPARLRRRGVFAAAPWWWLAARPLTSRAAPRHARRARSADPASTRGFRARCPSVNGV